MPTYDFEDVKTGEPVELVMQMSEAPKWGEVIKHGKRRLRRVVNPPPEGHAQRDIYFKCWQVSGPEYGRGARYYDPEDGCPVFTSKREVKDFLRAQGGNAEYGDGWTAIKP